MVFESFCERSAFPVALRTFGERALPGGDCRCWRTGRGLADLHVNDGQALPLAFSERGDVRADGALALTASLTPPGFANTPETARLFPGFYPSMPGPS